MIFVLFIWPLLIGAVLLSIGLFLKERVLRASGETFLAVACFLIIFQFYMIRDHTGWTEYGLFLESWSNYLVFAGAALAAGALVGDGIFLGLSKKSSSS